VSAPFRPAPLERRPDEEPLFITEVVGELRDGSIVVDAGAKTGSFPYAAYPSLRILSVDLDIPGAATRLPHVARARGDLLRLPVASASVDLLVCYYVIEHVPAPARAFAEAARVVKPGGLFFASVPESRRFDDRFYRFAGWTAKHLLGKTRKHPEHHGLTTFERMFRWMYASGFRVRSYAQLPAGFSWMNDPRTQSLQWGFISALHAAGEAGFDLVSRSNIMMLAERTGRAGVRTITHTCRRCGWFVAIDRQETHGGEWMCPYCATPNKLHRVEKERE
jgi:SAM-dependent methyltransferase